MSLCVLAYFRFWPVCVENIGVVCAVHHFPGLQVFVSSAVWALGLRPMPVRHTLTGVSHDALQAASLQKHTHQHYELRSVMLLMVSLQTRINTLFQKTPSHRQQEINNSLPASHLNILWCIIFRLLLTAISYISLTLYFDTTYILPFQYWAGKVWLYDALVISQTKLDLLYFYKVKNSPKGRLTLDTKTHEMSPNI